MAADTSLLRAMRVQFRVIHALLMWEVITRYGRDNLGFIWLFLEPMIFTLSVTALWYAVGLSHSVQLPIVAFALTGYSSVLLWRNCANRCSMAIPGNAVMFYHRPVRVLDVLLTKVFLEIVGASISLVVLSTFWISIGWMEPPHEIMKVLGAWFMLCWFGTSLGLILGAVTAFSEISERLWHPTSYILFPISGAVFMVDWLSGDFRELVLLLPMVHCLEMLRDGFFGPLVRTHYDMQYVAVVCAVFTALGLALVRAAGRRVNYQ